MTSLLYYRELKILIMFLNDAGSPQVPEGCCSWCGNCD